MTVLLSKLLSNGTDSSISNSKRFQMAAKNDSVPNGSIVPAKTAMSRFAIKGKEEGRRELALFFCTETSHAETTPFTP
jgi:hypothetical protein